MTDRTDNFNRSDRSLSGDTPSDGGSAWVVNAGSWNILANSAYKPNNFNTNETVTLESSVSDVDVQATNVVLGNTGLAVRLSDNNNYILCNVQATQALMYKRVGGTFTQIGSTYTGTFSINDVIKCNANGTSLTLYQNGVSRVTATESAGQTNTKHGLSDFSSNTAKWDDFSITGLAGDVLLGMQCL